MNRRRTESYIAVPAIVPTSLAFGILRLFKWMLAITCTFVVGFVLFQIVVVLNDVSHHRTPAALTTHAPKGNHRHI